MQLLVTFNNFLKSRQKILLKRRKIQIKTRPISNKRLQQERKVMNYSHEVKLLDIRKQLDRKKSQNHHINAIIQDLFYPQVQLDTPEEIQLRAKQISGQQRMEEQQWEKLMQMDDLTQQITEAALPLEIIKIHQARCSQFQVNHYALLFEKLSYYCVNKGKIQKKRIQNWQKLAAKLKHKEGNKNIKCPYLFLERQQIPRLQSWNSLIKQIHSKMQGQNSIAQFNNYLPILLKIQRIFYHIPVELYKLAFNRNIVQKIDSLSPANISDLLKLLKYRHKIKWQPDIKIEANEQSFGNVFDFASKLTSIIITQPQFYSTTDLLNIFKVASARKNKINIISQQNLAKTQNIILGVLNDLSFQDVEVYINTYTRLSQQPNIELIQILKFDLYRKAEQCINSLSLLSIISKIKARKLIFKRYRAKGTEPESIKLDGYDLLIKLAETISKTLSKLKTNDLIWLLDSYYDNGFGIQHISMVQILSAQIVKRGKQYSLQQLGKAFFKITLLGHRSKILTKFIFQEYHERYHNDQKKYKDEGNFLLPTDSKVESIPQMNMKQIHLQQTLLMTIWSLAKQLEHNDLQKQINLELLLHIFPPLIDSMDPLALELASNISVMLHQHNMFPPIICPKFIPNSFPTSRLKEFYSHDFQKSEIQLLMREQAKNTEHFVGTYNFKTNKFLPQKWSKQNTYSIQEYINYCQNTLIVGSQVRKGSYFDSQMIIPQQFVQQRNAAIRKYLQNRSNSGKYKLSQNSEMKPKLYSLLV